MASLRKRGKTWYYRFVDADGIKRERKGCSDRRATEEMARHAEAEAAKVRSGAVDARELARREHEARPLSGHVGDFQAAMLAKGNTPKHAALFALRVRRVAALARGAELASIDPPQTATRADREKADALTARVLGSARLADLTQARVQSALATLRKAGRSLQTCNHHRSAVKAFSRWAWKDGRLKDDPLVGVTGYNVKEDRRHDRRTLALDDLQRLIQTAHEGPTYQKMTGPTRALCYRLAVSTGLRYSEIASVARESFDLSGDAPTVNVEAAYTKNGEHAVLPLPLDLASDLRPLLATLPPKAPVFPLPGKGSKMLKSDLERAGIPYRDDEGRYFDFHALRCQCATLADQAGISPRVVQRLMRHSTLELTGRYTRPRRDDIEGAVSGLPSLRPSKHPSTAPECTAGQHIGKVFAHYLPTGEDVSGRNLSGSDVMAPTQGESPMERKPPETRGEDAPCRPLTASDENTPGRIRTCGLRFRKPPADGGNVLNVKPLRLVGTGVAHHLPTDTRRMPPELARLVDAWEVLPEAVRLAILAMVEASSPACKVKRG